MGVTLSKLDRPTDDAYQQLQKAYDFYNERLFDGIHRHPRSMGYFSPARFSSKSGGKADEIALNIAYFAVCPIEDTLSTLGHEQCHLWQHHFGTPGKKGYHNKEWAEKMIEIGLTPTSTGLPGGKTVGEKVGHYIEPEGKFELATKDLLSGFFDLSWYDRHVAVTPDDMRSMLSKLAESGVGANLSKLPADEYKSELDLYIPGQSTPLDFAKGKFGGKKNDTEEELCSGNEQREIASVNKSNRMTYVCPNCKLKMWGKPAVRIMCMQCEVQMLER